MSENPFVTIIKEIKKTAEEKRHVFATVASVGTSGISLRIDGESSGTTKNYTCNTDIHFAVGDRVIASRESGTYVVICKIGKPGGPEEKTAAMTQTVGVDANGKLWTTPAADQKISVLYASGSTTYNLTLNSDNILAPSSTGFEIGTSSEPFETIYVGSGSTYHWTINEDGIIPSSKSTLAFNIGSLTYPINTLYAQSIYLNGTKLAIGSDMAGSDVKMGGSTSYYILCNTSRELRPYSTSTSYPCYLGTSSYYWHYAYIGSNTASIGSSSSSKLGFFGTTPVVRQTLATTSNNMSYSTATSSNYLYILNNLVGILKNKYGLIS